VKERPMHKSFEAAGVSAKRIKDVHAHVTVGKMERRKHTTIYIYSDTIHIKHQINKTKANFYFLSCFLFVPSCYTGARKLLSDPLYSLSHT